MRDKTVQPKENEKGWSITEETLIPKDLSRNETLFSLGNGYFGMRGSFDEGTPVIRHGVFINGFYETEPIVYGERAHGYAKNRQTMINVPDPRPITLFANGIPFNILEEKGGSYCRILDMKKGLLKRSVCWEIDDTIIEIKSRRLVSFTRQHIGAVEYRVKVISGKAEIRLVSTILEGMENEGDENDPRIGQKFKHPPLFSKETGRKSLILQTTANSSLTVAAGIRNIPISNGNLKAIPNADEEVFTALLKKGDEVVLHKYFAFATTLEIPEEKLEIFIDEELDKVVKAGFEVLAEEQLEYLSTFWERSDVIIEGDDNLQQSVRFSLFSLLQAAGRDGKRSVPVKGLTGDGYEGHYFWDTEAYMLPFFTYTNPKIARKLIEYRIKTLPEAKARAAEMSQKGALYPWRTINGKETSAYFPAGTAQYHIIADIAHGLKIYLQVTGDEDILIVGGAEMLFETARLWADLGEYIPSKEGKFCISNVTGPDEYTALVDNNVYTNAMAADHLLFAAETARKIMKDHPLLWKDLKKRSSFTEEEITRWEIAGNSIYIPYDIGLGIHPQDDTFLNRPKWDFENTPKENYPLLLNYHPLVIYRHQVLKQPDVVLAGVFLSSTFSIGDKWRNYCYYNPITTGDSSLSSSIQAVAAAELGLTEEAYTYFMRTARIDLDDVNGNTVDGLHLAAIAGTWFSLVFGFGGFRGEEGEFSFNPRLPREWNRLCFKITLYGNLIKVDIRKDEVIYTLLRGDSVKFLHEYTSVELKSGEELRIGIKPKVEAFIFDLDGVITTTDKYHAQAWGKIAEELGIPFSENLNHKLKGIDRMGSLELILKEGGITLPEEKKKYLAEKKNNHYRELIKGITPADILPGIENLLKEIKDGGYRCAIASASKNAPTVLKSLGITDYFEYIADPAAIKKGKPDPEMHFLISGALKIPPRNCIALEDAQAGIDAINKAGMFSVAVGDALKNAAVVYSDTGRITLEGLKEKFG